MKSNAVKHEKNEMIGGDNIPPDGPDENGTGGPAEGSLMGLFTAPTEDGPHSLPAVGISRFLGEGVEE